MTDSKITDLTALTGANLATGDVFEVSDVSDTTMDASGTSKKMTTEELAEGLRRRAGLLGSVQYAPGSRTILSTTSTSLVAVDTTNLTVSFTAPASGKVLVRLTGFGQTGTPGFWALFTHGTSTQVGTSVLPATPGAIGLGVAAFLLTGLTPGTTYQYDWAHGVNTGTQSLILYASTGTTAAFSNQGAPATMEVWAA